MLILLREETESVSSPFFLAGGVYMVKINGTSQEAKGKTLAVYLCEADYDTDRVAVMRNNEIVPRNQYAETVLQSGDVVEIVSFVGGG